MSKLNYTNECSTCGEPFFCEHKRDIRCPYCRISVLESGLRFIKEDWEECSEIAPCPDLGYDMKMWCPYCIAVATLAAEQTR